MRWAWAALAALRFPAPAAGRRTGWKTVQSTDPWVFLERFCFEARSDGDEDDASFTFKVKHRGNGYLLLYFGTGTNDFRKMYKKSYSNLNLQERQRLATVAYRLPRTVDAEGTVIRGTWSRSSYLKSGSPRYLFIVYSNYDMDCNAVCQYSQYVEGEGPANVVNGVNLTQLTDAGLTAVELDFGWYVAPMASSANVFCNKELGSDPYCMGPVNIDYNFHLTNGDERLTREFSYDEITVFPTALAFFVFQSLLVVASLLVRRMLVVQRKLHHTARILNEAILFEWLSQLASVAYYGRYASTGRSSPWILTLSRMFRGVADVEMVLLFVFLAKGWTIVRRKLSIGGRIKVAVYGTTYALASFVALVWSRLGYDPAVVGFYYASYPGAFLAALRLFACCWFLYCCHVTRRTFKAKRAFFLKLTVTGAAWLAALPGAILTAYLCDDTARAKVFFALDLATFVAGQAALTTMYNPSTRFNKGFPFHELDAASLGMVRKRGAGAPDKGTALRRARSGSVDGRDGDARGNGGPRPGPPRENPGAPPAAAPPPDRFKFADELERAHLVRVLRINRALMDRIAILQHHSVEFHDALAMVEIPARFVEDVRPGSARHRGRDQRRASRGRDDAGAAPRPFSQPRTLLDAALDDALPEYSSARKRLGSGAGV